MKISNNINNGDVWGEIRKAKSKEEKKRLIDEMLSPQEKEEDENSNLTPNQMETKKQLKKLELKNTASKVASGEYVSDKDLKDLEKNDPVLLDASKLMNMDRKRIENEVKNAKTKKRAKEILSTERQGAITLAMAGSSSSHNGALGTIKLSAIDKAESNSHAVIRKKENDEKKAQIKNVRSRKKINKLV